MKTKKLICLVAVVAMLASLLSGCGQQAANDANVIKIGVNMEMTGGAATYGTAAVDGLKLAVKEVNAKGGINGKKVELVIVDNKSDAAESTNAITKLITDDKVCAVFGPATTSAVLAEIQVSEDNKVPILAPLATGAIVTVDQGAVRPFAFRACFIDPFQGKVLAEFLSKDLAVKNVAMLVDNSSDYSKGIAAVITADLGKSGVKIVANEAYLQKDQDFKATLTKIKAQNPQALVVPGYAEEAAKIVKQARELGMTCPIVGADGWDSPILVEVAGAKNMNNTYFTNHYSSQDPDPAVRKFVDDFKAEYGGKEPSFAAAISYDGAYLLFDAIKRAGGTDSEKIATALGNTKDLQLMMGKLSMDANHNPLKSAVIIEYKDGKQNMKTKIQPN